MSTTTNTQTGPIPEPGKNGHDDRLPDYLVRQILGNIVNPPPNHDNPVTTAISLDGIRFWAIAIYPRGVPLPGRDKLAEGKEPIGKAWGAERWGERKLHREFQRVPGAGVGICLGPGRGPNGEWLADVEGDGPEAEASRAVLFGGEEFATLGWGSARGGHQLVLLDGDRLRLILDFIGNKDSRHIEHSSVGFWLSRQGSGLQPEVEQSAGGFHD
jgi:hypothetical protein